MARKRQLDLPGLRRKQPPPMPRAKRDFNDTEFRRALERNGLVLVAEVTVADKATGKSICFVECRTDPLRVRRRATLAKALRLRA